MDHPAVIALPISGMAATENMGRPSAPAFPLMHEPANVPTMSKDTAQFLKFLSACLLPALVAGSIFDARWAKGSEWAIACLWLLTTLLAIGYVVDGLKGAKDLVTGTLSAWAITGAVALFLGTLVALKFGHSL